MGDRNDADALIEIREQVAGLHRKLAAAIERSDELAAVMVALFAQHGDPTHLTIERAAELRGCGTKTIRRQIAAGELTLEVVPGTRQSGIPIEQIYGRWIPIRVARQTIERMKAEGVGVARNRDGGGDK